jgi:hypothetical protein
LIAWHVSISFVSTSFVYTALYRRRYVFVNDGISLLRVMYNAVVLLRTHIVRSFVRSFIVRFIRPMSYTLRPRPLPHLPVTLRGKCETFEHLGSKEVAEVRRNNDPGATANITTSAFCLNSKASLSYSLGKGVDENEVEPIIVPESRESHEGIVVHCTSTR